MKSKKKKMFWKTVGISLLTLMLVLSLTACGGSTNSPEEVAETFFHAVKSGDVNGAMECYTPAIQKSYSGGTSIANLLFGIDSESLINDYVGGINAKTYENFDFEVSDTEINGKKATVDVDVYVDGVKKETTTVHCEEIDDTWYLTM